MKKNLLVGVFGQNNSNSIKTHSYFAWCSHRRKRKLIDNANREIKKQLDLTKFIHKQKMFVLTMLESLKPTKILSIETKSKPQVNNEEEFVLRQPHSDENSIKPQTRGNTWAMAQRTTNLS